MEKDNQHTAIGDPFEIDQLDRQILQLLVDHPTIKNTDIAKIAKIHVNTVYRRRNKPAFIKAYSDLTSTTEDLLKRAQKIAARRLMTFIKDPDKKIALDATKIALGTMPQKKEIDSKQEVIFQTRVGSQGQLMQEVIEVDNTHKENTSAIEASEPLDEKEDTPNDIQDNS